MKSGRAGQAYKLTCKRDGRAERNMQTKRRRQTDGDRERWAEGWRGKTGIERRTGGPSDNKVYNHVIDTEK